MVTAAVNPCFFLASLALAVLFIGMFWNFRRYSKAVHTLVPIAAAFLIGLFLTLINRYFELRMVDINAVAVSLCFLFVVLGWFFLAIPWRFYIYSISLLTFIDSFIIGVELYASYYLIDLNLLTSQYAFPCFSAASLLAACITILLLRSIAMRSFVECASNPVWLRLSFAPFISAAALFIFFIGIVVVNHDLSLWVTAVYVGLFLAMFIINFISLSVVFKAIKSEEYKRRYMLADQLLKMQKAQYKLISDNIAATKRARHDIRHQIMAVKQMIDEADTQSMKAYLSEMEKHLPHDVETRYCENYAVNCIFGEYADRAKRDKVRFETKLDIREGGDTSDLELTILFGNALENAFDATVRLPEAERWVDAKAQQQGSMLNIFIKNSFDGNLEYNGDLLLSRKRNYDEVGLGLASIQGIVEQRHGIMKIETHDDSFLLFMMVSTAGDQI